MAQRFLVIQTAFLGDAVLITSILEKLHAWFPDAGIEVLVRHGNQGLFDGHPFLRRVHVWDKRKGKTRALFKLIGDLRRTPFDQVINTQRFFSTGLITALVKGKEKVGYDKNPLSVLFDRRIKHVIGDGRHEVDRLNALVAHVTDDRCTMPRLYPSEVHRKRVRELLSKGDPGERPYVTMAPASVWFTKQWPESKWIALIKALPQDVQVYLIGGPGDHDLAQRIIGFAGRGVDLTRDLKLLESAALMEGARMNYVNDSAPLHIASAMNAPVTAVFCSTVPAFGFGPLRQNGRVVEIDTDLPCRPCGLHGHKACPQGHFRCAEEIPIGRLLS